MTTTLDQILDHVGFAPRPQQVKLFDALLATDETGLVAQAGTGTGKSLAVFAAAAEWRKRTELPSLVVVPTNILLRQYIETDAPRAEAALGITIRSLMGRGRYLCAAAPGFSGLARADEWVRDREVELNAQLRGDEPVMLSPKDAEWFGCPGRDEGCDGEGCHYRLAKGMLGDADIIVTNAHLLVLDDQLRAKPEVTKEDPDTGETLTWQPSIFPDFGALFVDECHTLEDVLRGFASRSIPLNTVDAMGVGLANWIRQATKKDAYAMQPDGVLVGHLRELANYTWAPGDKVKKREKEAKAAADFILRRGKDGAYADNEAVLWFTPGPYTQDREPNGRLTSTQINLAGGARNILTKVPFALVSGTVPKSLRAALGISDARFVDCGHPFDYGKQGKLKISKHSGSFKATKLPNNRELRADEVLEAVKEAKGGALVLFSSYKDMEEVYTQIRGALKKAGLDVRMQTREGDKGELGKWFKEHGNAVLFGTESFATGFDCPGDVLRLVVVWKLPYPSLDPVTKAIQARNRQRYEDMMRTKITQAVGRLIRTTTDTGTIFIADSRAEDLIGDDDPMLAHLSEFERAGKPKRVRAWDIE